ncbi:MAG: dTDP-4-dehydrorhamnose 3,5-epimerase [Bdellovibrionaceae bacterium]|nr:dTDP-4-dehydrorhamnose 3,5-epimerase [Pseudobdellovibrionaceae bacterium]
MDIKEFKISGPKLITLKTFGDDRGFFCERFKLDPFAEIGIKNLVQDNFSRSTSKVLRGLHYQWDKPQGKLVTVTRGSIFDVAVDIRKDSPTFGQHISVVLTDTQPQWFWIPAGFAHGFCVVDDQGADVMYKVDNYWNGKGESGIAWNDPTLKIDWPYTDPELSPKDSINKSFKDYTSDPKF